MGVVLSQRVEDEHLDTGCGKRPRHKVQADRVAEFEGAPERKTWVVLVYGGGFCFPSSAGVDEVSGLGGEKSDLALFQLLRELW